MASNKTDMKNNTMRFNEMLDVVRENYTEKSGKRPSDETLAELAGIPQSSFSYMKRPDKSAKVENKFDKAVKNLCASEYGECINVEYVLHGKGKLMKTKTEEPIVATLDDDDDELEILGEISDDDNEAVIDSTIKGSNDVSNKATDVIDNGDDEGCPFAFDADKMANDIVVPSKSDGSQVTIKTAKDKWLDDAIELGISADALDDHFMQVFSIKDGKLHLFKEPEGALPYRQEVFDIQAVGLGKPTVINYEDDKVKYGIKYALIFEGDMELDCNSENEAYAKLFKIFGGTKFKVEGHEFKFKNLTADIKPIKK